MDIDDVTMQNLILSHLVTDETYCRKVLPHLNRDYFSMEPEKIVFDIISNYIEKYGASPTQDSLKIDLKNKPGLNESTYKASDACLDTLIRDKSDRPWLVDATEKFCKKVALYNALIKASTIIEDNSGEMPDSIPSILSEALSVGFNNQVGHDYFKDRQSRYESYHAVEDKIPFDIDILNDITKGGISKKTITVILGGTGVGKTLIMCHQAASNLRDGKNVLYITMEMSQIRISERIDANMLDIRLDDLVDLLWEEYDEKIKSVNERTIGQLIVKEYPTAQAHSGHFRSLLKELKIKKNFTPDIIYIDYINICASSRVKAGSNSNSYTLVKSIAEELRGLAVEFDVALVTATQTTRSGLSNSDLELSDTSESVGLPYTADLMYAVITNEEFDKSGHYMIKQLKNRYSAPEVNRRFLVGVTKAKMKLHNVDQPKLATMGQAVIEKTQTKDGKLSSELQRKINRLT